MRRSLMIDKATAEWKIRLTELYVSLDKKYDVLRIAEFGVASGVGFLVVEVILAVGLVQFYHTVQIPSIAFSSPAILGLTALAFGTGTTFAFVVNEHVTFKDYAKSRQKLGANWLVRWSRYQLASLLGNVLIVIMQLALLATISLSPVVGNIIAAIATYPLAYFVSMHFVWGIKPLR